MALSSGKVGQYDYLTKKKYYFWIKLESFSKINKSNLRSRKKQVGALKVLKLVEYQQKPKSIGGVFRNDLENSEAQNDLNKIKELEEQINRNYLI